MTELVAYENKTVNGEPDFKLCGGKSATLVADLLRRDKKEKGDGVDKSCQQAEEFALFSRLLGGWFLRNF